MAIDYDVFVEAPSPSGWVSVWDPALKIFSSRDLPTMVWRPLLRSTGTRWPDDASPEAAAELADAWPNVSEVGWAFVSGLITLADTDDEATVTGWITASGPLEERKRWPVGRRSSPAPIRAPGPLVLKEIPECWLNVGWVADRRSWPFEAWVPRRVALSTYLEALRGIEARHPGARLAWFGDQWPGREQAETISEVLARSCAR